MRHHHRADLDSPFWWFRLGYAIGILIALAALVIAWLLQGLIVLPAAAAATAAGKRDLARRMTRTLTWMTG